jgi:hypothetical protein
MTSNEAARHIHDCHSFQGRPVTGTLAATSSGTVSAYGAGNVAFGEYSGSSNTTGFTAEQRYHSARFVVVKYL